MSGFTIRDVRLGRLAKVTSLALAGALGAIVIACSSDTPTTQGDDASIDVQTGSFSVTLENKSGVPLIDLKVAILAGGVPYTHLVSRMEVAEKSELPLTAFSDRTGTTFNLRVMRPKTVTVTAKDLVSKEYKVDVPWK
jgi:hypothetical protein